MKKHELTQEKPSPLFRPVTFKGNTTEEDFKQLKLAEWMESAYAKIPSQILWVSWGIPFETGHPFSPVPH